MSADDPDLGGQRRRGALLTAGLIAVGLATAVMEARLSSSPSSTTPPTTCPPAADLRAALVARGAIR